MKRLTALFFATIAGVCLGCQKAPAGGPAEPQQQTVKQMARSTVNDRDAADAALRFLDRVDQHLGYQSDFSGPFEDYEGNVKRSMDRNKMEFSLFYETPDPDKRPFSISVKVYRPRSDKIPEVYFPELDLAVETVLDLPGDGNPYSSRPVAEIIGEAQFVLRMAQPSVGGRAAGMLDPMIMDIKDEISSLSSAHPSLQNFAQEARLLTDRDNMEYGIFFSHNMSDESTMGAPNGEMLGPDSVYISFYVREYNAMMNRYRTGRPEGHQDVLLKNLNLEASWTIETRDEELPGIIYSQIIEPRLKQLKQLDASIAE